MPMHGVYNIWIWLFYDILISCVECDLYTHDTGVGILNISIIYTWYRWCSIIHLRASPCVLFPRSCSRNRLIATSTPMKHGACRWKYHQNPQEDNNRMNVQGEECHALVGVCPMATWKGSQHVHVSVTDDWACLRGEQSTKRYYVDTYIGCFCLSCHRQTSPPLLTTLRFDPLSYAFWTIIAALHTMTLWRRFMWQ